MLLLHFSLLFLFFCDICPLPSSLAAADFSDRSWHVPTAPAQFPLVPAPVPNPVAVVVLAAASVATLVLAVASDCRAAASAAAAAARHACCVCVSFFLSYITLTFPPRT